MIEIPDRLVGYFKISNSREEARNNPTQPEAESKTIELNPSERGPLSYMSHRRIYRFKDASKIKKQKGYMQ
jgi:hypothetical protein